MLSSKDVPTFLKKMEQEHENLKKELLYFATNCSDYITLSEAFSMPYNDRKLLIKIAEERYKKMEEHIKSK